MYEKLQNLKISTKLFMLTVMICAAFIVIAYITIFSYSKVSSLLTDIVDRDLERVIVNAHAMRELSKLFADRDLLNHTFYGKKDYLKSEGTRLLGVVKNIEESMTDPELKESLLTLSGKLESFLSQCESVNAALFDVNNIEKEIYNDLIEFENMVSESMINLTMEGKDTSFIKQQMMLAVGFRESLLQIGKLFSEVERIQSLTPQNAEASPVIVSLDDLILRFQTLTSSSPDGTKYSHNLLRNGKTYRESILRYFKVIEQLGSQMKDLADSRTKIISQMQIIDSEISKSSQILDKKVKEIIVSFEGIVLIVSSIVVIMLGIFVLYFTRSHISRPMKNILNGIGDFRERKFDTRIKLGRKDEWNMIENSFNDMAFELNNLLNKMEQRIEERTAELEAEIVERRKSEEATEELLKVNELILSTAGEGIYGLDLNGNTTFINPAAAEMIGWNPEELIGLNQHKVLHHSREDGSPYPPEECPIYAALNDGEVHRVSNEVFWRKDGSCFPVEYISTPMRNKKGEIEGAVVVFSDITGRKHMEEDLKHHAYHDRLTGLPNRVLFSEQLALGLSHARRNEKILAVLFLDIDRFKYINDTLGHAAGDTLLKDIAHRLKTCIRESDIISRRGGDEFTVLLSDISQEEDAIIIGNKILESFREPFVIENNKLHVSTSIGISVFPKDGHNGKDLLGNADIAMYNAKEQGRNGYRFYNPAMNKSAIERTKIESTLRHALERRELTVYYQPIVDVFTGRICYAEALVRWEHPELGMLSPLQFITIAEEIGLITAIDKWVLTTACSQIRTWRDRGYHPLCVTVNLSSCWFHPSGLVDIISQVLTETGLAPEYLGIEITKSTAMHYIEHTASKLIRLNDMGVRISIDDFGTGYSSLSYLKKLPTHKLKIDKSFIGGLTEDSDNKSIVSTVIHMAHDLNLRVVAEGVETEEQLSFLRTSKCDEVQGYLFSKPLPEEDFEKLIEHSYH
ncbi:MAG: EAL domain-containing protein [Nitrospiraceae bacterium]|nr:MAG: EAL domain-containing protein [Nitrospiraceae bacterium]